MKRMIIISAEVAMCLALGCEKKTDQPEEPIAFDVDIDGPPCVLAVPADENLLADQRELARQIRIIVAEGGLTPTPSPTPSPAPATRPAATMPAPDTSL